MVIKAHLGFGARAADRAVESRDLIIVVDVLRSTTTIVYALANGVSSIIPIKTLKEAYRLHREYPDYILTGERRGQKPKGFDFGNSPSDFTSKELYRRNMIITTSSGTVALTHSQEAEWILVGAFLNASLVAKKAVDIAENRGIDISCVLAGEKGRFSLEDFVCAGAIAERLPEGTVQFSDKTRAAMLAFKQIEDNLLDNIMKAEHARHLLKLGFGNDIELSCQLDTFQVVPIYKNGKITIL